MRGAHIGPTPIYWCRRCGTIRTGDDKGGDVPALVERCREFEAVAAVAEQVGFKPGWVRVELRRLGIAESIRLLEGRPECQENQS